MGANAITHSYDSTAGDGSVSSANAMNCLSDDGLHEDNFDFINGECDDILIEFPQEDGAAALQMTEDHFATTFGSGGQQSNSDSSDYSLSDGENIGGTCGLCMQA